MEIRELLWRPANVQKLSEHRISREEVEAVIDDAAWVSYVHPEYPEQVRLVGVTGTGRYITVALAPTHDPVAWRPVTGWEATRGEREYHRENSP